MYVHGALAAHHILAPNPVEQLPAREDPARTLSEEHQQLVLAPGERDGDAVQQGLAASAEDLQRRRVGGD